MTFSLKTPRQLRNDVQNLKMIIQNLKNCLPSFKFESFVGVGCDIFYKDFHGDWGKNQKSEIGFTSLQNFKTYLLFFKLNIFTRRAATYSLEIPVWLNVGVHFF